MSSSQISRSPDLKRLRDEGYHVEIHPEPAHLLIREVPYVSSDKVVKRGTLVSTLALAGGVTTKPDTHVAMFAGETPCDQHGVPLTRIINSSGHQTLGEELEIDHTFSSKPPEGYPNYHAKMTAYINMLGGAAQALDPSATAQTYPVVVDDDEDDSTFFYLDTASSRVGIGAASAKLRSSRVAIVGLGGTGSYVLDLIAKTPVDEIHLYDKDVFEQHSAFRAPGAASAGILDTKPLKVDYFGDIYDAMKRRIIRHAVFIDATNVGELRAMDFVFICVDDANARVAVVDFLEEAETSFVDVGMGVQEVMGALNGIVRVTTSTPADRSTARSFLPLTDAEVHNDYDHNIQVADLNALNAALAVIRWKKEQGFYADYEHEHHSSYTIDGNRLINETGGNGR